MREELKHCPVCEATSFEDAVSTVDYSTSKEEFTVQKCTECSHLFTSPRVVENEIGPYYDNPNYISHTNENKSLFGQVYQVLRGVNLRRNSLTSMLCILVRALFWITVVVRANF